jgi:hypothetical protein
MSNRYGTSSQPVSPYFYGSQNKSEQNMYEDIIVESIRQRGILVFYLPREIINENGIFNEEELVKFSEQFGIGAYVNSIEGYEGDGALLSNFGLELRQQMKLVVSKRDWGMFVGRFLEDSAAAIRPREGDLIYVPMVKGLFEINNATDLNPFYQLQNKCTYELTCELFEYNGQEIDTDNENINEFERRFGTKTFLQLSGVTGEFQIGEEISADVNGITVTAEVAEFDKETDEMYIVTEIASDGSNTSLTDSILITGAESNATGTIGSIDDFSSLDKMVNAQNVEFEIDGNNFIDFSRLDDIFGMPDAT